MIKSKNKKNNHSIYFNSIQKFKMLEGIDKYAKVFADNLATNEIKYNLSKVVINNPAKSRGTKLVKSVNFPTRITPEIARQIQEIANTEGVTVDEFLSKITGKTKEQDNTSRNLPEVTRTENKIDLGKSRKWLKENRHKYLGQWIVLDGNKLIGAGENPQPFVEKARTKGVKIPFVKYIEDNSKPFTGGWL